MMSTILWLVVSLTILASSDGATLTLSTSHERIGHNGTHNFTMACTMGDLETFSGDIKPSEVVKTIQRLRLLKSEGSLWNPVVEFDSDWEAPRLSERVEGDSYHETNLGGNVNLVGVKWSLASDKDGGEYMCELLADSVLGLGMWIRSSPVYVHVEIALTLHDLLRLMKSTEAKLDAAIADIKANEKAIEKALQWQGNEQRKWPKGHYSLLQPESGCPEKVGWQTGWMKHHTESFGSRTKNHVSSPANMKRPIREKYGENFYMTQHFCSISNTDSVTTWPSGTYCIMKMADKDCPDGFDGGMIRWDDEDINNNSSRNGTIPWDLTDHPHIYFCCREDKIFSSPMSLPTVKPFFLHRYKDVCQNVEGMFVTEEFMFFETERNSPVAVQKGANPSSLDDFPNVKVNLCYYQKSL